MPTIIVSPLWSLLFALLVITHISATKVAVSLLQNNGTNMIAGTVKFEQEGTSPNVTVSVDITNLEPGSVHGFHVHQYGDTSDIRHDPPSTGYHFFPLCQPSDCYDDQTHGFPPNIVRHAGDMGNMEVDSNGEVHLVLTMGQGKMSLNDTVRSILGRAIVVHALPDDGGKPYGHAGDVIAAGVIGIASTSDASIAPATPVSAVVCVLHNVQDLKSAPDYGAKGFAEIENYNTMEDFHVKVKIRNVTATTSTLKFAVYTYGDMQNVPTTLGDPFATNVLPAFAVAKSCNGSRMYWGTSTKNQDLGKYVGRGCAVLEGSTVIAAGVFGLANPDRDTSLFQDYYFTSNGQACTTTSEPSGDSGLSGGAIAGIVIACVVASVVFVLTARYMTTTRNQSTRKSGARKKVDEEEYARAPIPDGLEPSSL